jgi:single-strand DNA-binding protein
MNVNKAILVGRLTRDPDVRTTQNGQTVTTLGIATNHTWTDKTGQRQEKTEFHNVVLWGRLAEIAGQYLAKGSEAYVEGRLQNRTYTAKDGTERRVTEIVAENMQLGARPQGGGNQNGGYAPRQSAAPSRPQSAPARPAPKKSAPTEDENIPTINLDDEKEEVNIEDVPF